MLGLSGDVILTHTVLGLNDLFSDDVDRLLVGLDIIQRPAVHHVAHWIAVLISELQSDDTHSTDVTRL